MHIRIENLSYSYPDGQKALSQISLNILKGERVAILGPNGAGKSTLLLHLNGILKGSGEIVVDGIELTNKTISSIRRKVGIIFQDPNDQLFCPTVREDVEFGPLHFGLKKDEIDELVFHSLEQVAMQHTQNRISHHLSLGERKRVSIAAVLACSPDILIFDEPVAMLDPKRKRELISFIKQSDKTIIIATHDPVLALNTCNRCVLMNEGKIVYDGPAEDVLQNQELLLKHGL